MSTQSVYSRIILKSQKLINEGIVIIDAGKKNLPILFINKGFKKITGLKSAEILGRGIKFFYNNNSTPGNLEKFQKAIADKKNMTADLYIRKNNDQLCYCRISVSFVKVEPNPAGYFLLIVRDITEIRKGLLSELKLDVVRATLRSVNDIVYNYMNGLMLFRTDCENHCKTPEVKFDLFDRQYNATLKALKKLNGMREYKESRIGGAGSNLVMLAPE